MSLMIFRFWIATMLTFLKNGLRLLKGKALIPNYGRSKATNLALMVEERIIFETHFN